MVYIKGQIHPSNPENRRKDVDDLTSAQIKLTNMGYRRDADLSVEAPVIVEHQGMPVGRVTSTWAGPDDSLRMSAYIDDPVAEELIRSGKMRGLSIGARLMHDASVGVEGALIENLQDEVSICARPRRPGCYITEIDGRHVMTVANASMDSYPPGASRLAVAAPTACVARTHPPPHTPTHIQPHRVHRSPTGRSLWPL